MSDTNPEVKFGGDASGLNSAINEAKGKIGEFTESVAGIKESLMGLGEGLAAAFAVEKIDEFSRSMTELGENIERTSKMTGLSIDEIQKFQFAVKMTGGDAESAGQQLMRLERNIANANAGSDKAKESFAAAGVSMKTLASGDVNAIMGEIADKFHNTADGANKVAVAIEIGGRGFAQMIPYLDAGRAGMEEFNSQLAKTNSELTTAQVDGFAKTAEQIKVMDAATLGVSVQVMDKLNPGINGAVAGLTAMKEAMSEDIKNGGALAQIVEGIGYALMGLVGAVDTVKTGLMQLFDVAKGVFLGMIDSAKGTAQAIDDLFHGKLVQAAVDFGKAQTKALEDVKAGFSAANDEGIKLYQTLQKMAEAHDAAVIPSGGSAASQKKDTRPQIQVPDQSGKSKDDNKNDEANKRSIYSEDYAVKKEMDDLKVQSGKMSKQEELNDLQDELQKEHALIDQSFENEKALYDKDSVQYQKLADEKYIADQKYAIEKMKLDQQASADSAKVWTSAFDTIERASSQMLNGILQGTQTWHQAMMRLSSSLVLSFIDDQLKIGLNWIKTQAMQLIGQQTTDGEKVASTQAATVAGMEAQKASDAAAIASSAAVASAGAYASVAAIPFIGWAMAPDVAADAYGSVLAMEGLVALETGSMRVKEGAYHLHDDEAVLPKGQAEQFRKNAADAALGGGSSGGQTHVHFNVSAMDSKDVGKFFEQHGSKIADQVSKQFRNGRRPNWA